VLISELAGCAVGILGTGSEGRAAWRLLRRRLPGQRLALFTEGTVDTAFAAELEDCGDLLHLGPLGTFDLQSFDVLVRSPGISPYREELRNARAAGVRFTSGSNIWFAEHPGARTVCITGTKGKSTTTALTGVLLEAAGIRAGVAGNIGQPLLEVDTESADWWVIELSSYQLADFEGHPDVAGILNLAEDHLDWHAGREHYRRDKLRLAARVRGPLVANAADAQLRHALAGRPGVRWFNRADGWHPHDHRVVRPGLQGSGYTVLRLRGRHNLDNLAAALTLAECVAPLAASAASALEEFAGLPHRLRELGERDGLRYVDDSLSTTPMAVLAALEALQGPPVALLVGGLDRGVDWGAVAEQFRDCMPQLMIALPDNGPHILAEFDRRGLRPPGGMHQTESLESAVALAQRLMPRGGVVLLSPGAPSFPHFADYRARGAAFAKFAGFDALVD